MKTLATILLVSLSFFAKASDTTKVSVQVGVGSKYLAVNVVDIVTGNFVTATISNVSIQNLNAELATVTSSDPTTIRIMPIAAGKGTAIVTCHVDYVDAGDGQPKSEDKSSVISYTVIGAAHGVKLSIN